jgi:hypothetical protein
MSGLLFFFLLFSSAYAPPGELKFVSLICKRLSMSNINKTKNNKCYSNCFFVSHDVPTLHRYARTFFYAPLCTFVPGERCCTHVPPLSKGTLGQAFHSRSISGIPSTQGLQQMQAHPPSTCMFSWHLSALNADCPKWPASSSHVAAVRRSVFGLGHGPVRPSIHDRPLVELLRSLT